MVSQLRGCLMISEDGVTFEVAKPDLAAPKVHDVVNVEKYMGEYKWRELGFEKIVRLPPAGADIVRQAWHKDDIIKTPLQLREEAAITRLALNKDKFSKNDRDAADWSDYGKRG